MTKLSQWIEKNCRLASDTSDGALMKRRLEAIVSDIKRLKSKAIDDGPRSVMSRFRTDVRRAIELLPPVDRVRRMDLWQLSELDVRVNKVKGMLERYRIKGPSMPINIGEQIPTVALGDSEPLVIRRLLTVIGPDGKELPIRTREELDALLASMTSDQLEAWKGNYRFAPILNYTRNSNYTGTETDTQ